MKHFKSTLIVGLAVAALLLTIAIPGLVVRYLMGADSWEALMTSLAWAGVIAIIVFNGAIAREDEDE